jgi:phage terminase large subunit
MAAEVTAQVPEKLEFLFKPARWKILHGGRAGAKSWGIARALLILGAERPLRVICCREIQKSIAESVHQLLDDQIGNLGLRAFYSVLLTEIRGRNGTTFTFHGLKHNVDNIKSLEGADIVWVEEARIVSVTSWNKLIPTIRKPGSEIWISFNPELEDDPTYQRFVVRPPTGAIVVKMDYKDNPFLSAESKQDIADTKSRSLDDYLHIYGGHCKTHLDGAVFASELRGAEARIMHVPYTPTKPVNTYWDLGFEDATAIWFVQRVGFEWRVIDYLESNQKTLGWFIQELQKKLYTYDIDHFPHDGKNKTLQGGGKSLEDQARALGRRVKVIPNTSLAAQINLARTIFANCYFDREKCADGLHALRNYVYEVDPDTNQFSKTPLHNWASHGASAFMGFAVSAQDNQRKPKNQGNDVKSRTYSRNAWMGN